MFPLFDGVSVVAFECSDGYHVIRGVVKEKHEAQHTYQTAIACGQAAGLLEQGETSDVFSISLGNIPTGSKLTVNLEYVGKLKHDMASGAIRYTLPTVISPRYGYGVVEASEQLSTLSTSFSVTVDITLPEGDSIQKITSPSHPIAVALGKASTETTDSMSLSWGSSSLSLGNATLEKDFILEVAHQDDGRPRALLEIHPTLKSYRALMATLVPPIREYPVPKLEVIIVADQNGSMSGGRMRALQQALKTLFEVIVDGGQNQRLRVGFDISLLLAAEHDVRRFLRYPRRHRDLIGYHRRH